MTKEGVGDQGRNEPTKEGGSDVFHHTARPFGCVPLLCFFLLVWCRMTHLCACAEYNPCLVPARPLGSQVVAMLCKLPYKGITRERILLALAHKGYKKKGEFEHELRVVYELMQGNKLHRERLRVSLLLLLPSLLRRLFVGRGGMGWIVTHFSVWLFWCCMPGESALLWPKANQPAFRFCCNSEPVSLMRNNTSLPLSSRTLHFCVSVPSCV